MIACAGLLEEVVFGKEEGKVDHIAELRTGGLGLGATRRVGVVDGRGKEASKRASERASKQASKQAKNALDAMV